MPPSSPCRWRRIMPSMLAQWLPAAARGDTQLLQQAVGARAARLQPDLIEPQDVARGVPIGRLTDLVQGVDQRLELGGELREYLPEDGAAAATERVCEAA